MTVRGRVRHIGGLSLLLLLATAGSALAHHSFAMFDHTRTVTLKGEVTKFQWTNPHAILEIDVPGSAPQIVRREVFDGTVADGGRVRLHL